MKGIKNDRCTQDAHFFLHTGGRPNGIIPNSELLLPCIHPPPTPSPDAAPFCNGKPLQLDEGRDSLGSTQPPSP